MVRENDQRCLRINFFQQFRKRSIHLTVGVFNDAGVRVARFMSRVLRIRNSSKTCGSVDQRCRTKKEKSFLKRST
jgi:hypothetical protein